MYKHAKITVFSWCHSATRRFVKARYCFSMAMSDNMGMDSCTLPSIFFLITKGVFILYPCPSTPGSCPNLLFMSEPRTSLFFHARVKSRSILSTASRFISGLRCFLEVPPNRDISPLIFAPSLSISAAGSVFLLYLSVQNKASRSKTYDAESPMKKIKRGRGEAGLIITAPTPVPTQLLRLHLTFSAWFASLLLLLPSDASQPFR